MKVIALSIAVLVTLSKHYLFSFQRFTLQIARKHATNAADVSAIQLLMSPALLGTVGWLVTVLWIGTAVLVSMAFAWWVGIAYLIADLLVAALVPLFPFNDHFAQFAKRQLARELVGPNASLASALWVDVIRVGAGHTI